LKEEKKIAIFGEKKNRSSKTNKAKKRQKEKKNRFKNRVVDFGDRKWHRKIDQ
jgi:hypothetical protein